ncbi:hypothetical protein QM467_16340 [Rhodoblastus sp. 17X3]|uniref:beta strand repeat-containing protein n=1 Tax=Rhodoblastus sp. 17X3 TaxID=3047026 RepID=UPI0024B670A9|nr:hypothetical protein [Rhodoblastus sp. 17X3]MDI9849625.1 hypothetical protein [Rhodoblastus sp. 17X3]
MAEISSNQTTTYVLSTSDPNLTVDVGVSIRTATTDGIDGYSGGAWKITNFGAIVSNGGYGAYGIYLSGASNAISNYGWISGSGGVNLTTGGSVVNASGATIQGTGSTSNGISAVSGVHVSNGAGTVSNSGTITALGYGVGLDNGGSVTNYAGGSITGGEDGVFFYGSSGYLDNFGQIKATIDDGVGFFAGGTLINEVGGIVNATSTGGTGPAAVYFAKAAGALRNDGSMIGTLAGAYFQAGGSIVNGANSTAALLQGGTYGVYVSGGAGSVTNAGTITGGSYSVDFATSSASNLLVVDPGAIFNGAAVGGGGTLELAAGAGVGAIGGISSGSSGNFRNFGVLTVDSGATWTLSGVSNAITNVTDNGTLIVTGTLKVSTAVAASSTGKFQLGVAGGSGTLEVASETGSLSQTNFVNNGKLIIDNAASFGANVGTTSYGGPLLMNFGAGDVIDILNFSASGATISFNSATGLAQIGNGKQTATLKFDISTLAAGTLQVASDGGTGLDVTLVPAPNGPGVVSVSASAVAGSGSPSDDLGIGGVVTISLTMSAPVSVNLSAPPSLVLNDGGTAAYPSGSSSSTTLVFQYVVSSGQNTSALAVSGALNGTSITDATGAVANLTGAYETLSSASSSIQIDTTPPAAPTISGVTYGGTGTWSLNGFAESGSTVTIFDRSAVLGSSQSVAGAWGYATIEDNTTVRVFSATATDGAGNVSAPSAMYFEGTTGSDVFSFASEPALAAAGGIFGNGGVDAISMSGAATLTDADFVHVQGVSQLNLLGASTATLGPNAAAAGVAALIAGAGNTSVTDSGSGTLNVNAAALPVTATLTLSSGSGTEGFTVTNLGGNLNASAVKGSIYVTATGTNQKIVAGSGADTINAGPGDVITGGGGADVFAASANVSQNSAALYDTVTDFGNGADHFAIGRSLSTFYSYISSSALKHTGTGNLYNDLYNLLGGANSNYLPVGGADFVDITKGNDAGFYVVINNLSTPGFGNGDTVFMVQKGAVVTASSFI